MDTPICDFVKKYKSAEAVRLHMPGHKGKAFFGGEEFDITEIPGADVLYSSSGIIRKSEENASKLFGTARTVYSAEGSSLSVRAMLYLISLYASSKGEKPFILAGRNAHKVFITACALLDIETAWIFPKENSLISCKITANELDTTLSNMKTKPTAVYLTSPDYLGHVSDIKALSEVCKNHGVLLAVDNAHGAYLNFTEENRHPINLGADLCCDSAHKTLPVLTGGGYLHISKNAPEIFSHYAEKAMSLFASSSPSYLILQSLDKANDYLEKDFPKELREFSKEVSALKERLIKHGFELFGDEELKITIKAKAYGCTGEQMGEYLESKNIFCEFADPDFVVLMLTPQNTKDELKQLENALLSLEKKEPILTEPPKIGIPKRAITPREALFLKQSEKDVRECLGDVLGAVSVSCPPAIPIVSLGEVIDEKAVEAFLYYGIEKVSVYSR